jgi:hypothetical protein
MAARVPARPILVEMEPTVEERLARIREVTDRGLRYYATAYLNTDVGEEHMIAERDLLMAYMNQLANVVALLEGDDLSDRAMLGVRQDVVSRHVEAAGIDPWVPPAAPGS